MTDERGYAGRKRGASISRLVAAIVVCGLVVAGMPGGAIAASGRRTVRYSVTVKRGVLASGRRVKITARVVNPSRRRTGWWSRSTISSVVAKGVNGGYRRTYSHRGYRCRPRVRRAITYFTCARQMRRVPTSVRLTFAVKFAGKLGVTDLPPFSFEFYGQLVRIPVVVPAGASDVRIEAVGGGGGELPDTDRGGAGAKVDAVFPVSAGDTLFVTPAGAGEPPGPDLDHGAGGGGGLGALGGTAPTFEYSTGGGGGGASTVELEKPGQAPVTEVVAGGGGGVGENQQGTQWFTRGGDAGANGATGANGTAHACPAGVASAAPGPGGTDGGFPYGGGGGGGWPRGGTGGGASRGYGGGGGGAGGSFVAGNAWGASIQPFDQKMKNGYVSGEWEAAPTHFPVTFSANGGWIQNPVEQALAGGPVAKPVNPGRPGYTFDGWYTAATGGVPWDFTTPIVAARTLYAHWTGDPITVLFDGDGGSDTAALHVPDGQAIPKPADPTRPGYTFAGWFVQPTGGTAWLFTTPVTETTGQVFGIFKLYARWTATG